MFLYYFLICDPGEIYVQHKKLKKKGSERCRIETILYDIVYILVLSQTRGSVFYKQLCQQLYIKSKVKLEYKHWPVRYNYILLVTQFAIRNAVGTIFTRDG
jgi:hypothetical protein